jgi:beta-glucanase (GH16 family)
MKAFYLKPTTLLMALMVILLNACREDEPASDVLLPSSIELEVSLDEEVEGKVDVTVTATSANFYSFDFGVDDATYVESEDGIASFTYSEAGQYVITARAHALQDEFVETSENVEIAFTVPTVITQNGDSGYRTPTSYDGYTLVWNEEFVGTSLSDADWNYELGTGSSGWGNNELQYYQEENATVDGGRLTIEAREEVVQGSNYTSARLTTEGKKEFQYGRIDIRARAPYGQGIWPALWMMGSNFSTAGWPFCGEIDIMEMVGGVVDGGGDDVVHGTVHWDNDGQYANYGDSKTMPAPLANAFHVYSIIWDENEIAWYIDDVRYNVIDITPPALSEFHQPFFFIVNVAVGGNWPGDPDATTTFPQYMDVDYIRVFQEI